MDSTDLTPPATAEIWRQIPGLDPRYRVSSLGRVSGPRTPILACAPDKHGYIRTGVMKACGTRRTMFVHTLVALAFLGPRPAGYDIDHIDRDRTNNAASNLRYLTHAENMALSVQPMRPPRLARIPRPSRQGVPLPSLRGTNNPKARLTEAQAIEILAVQSPGRRGKRRGDHPNSIKGLAARYGVSKVTISDLRRGKTWPHLHRPTEPKSSEPEGRE